MSDSHFQLLLHAARSQPEPQRLLFVFTAAALPAEATAEQKLRFEAGEGGELAPVMVVDKDPHALTTFESLVAESGHIGQGWRVVFVAGLSGRGRTAPSDVQTEHALNEMVDAVRQGNLGRYVAYDVHGEPLSFS
ncbi:MAG: ribonucleotide reductase subunit alpha [Betaproteobacteria bacterium]